MRRTLRRLPTLTEMRRTKRALPKASRPAKHKHTENVRIETLCREVVWTRDQNRSRASGTPLLRVHSDERVRGEVAHLAKRSTSPAAKWDPNNCVLLSAEEHRLSDARHAPGGQVLLQIEGTDARKLVRFTRLDAQGTVLWARES